MTLSALIRGAVSDNSGKSATATLATPATLGGLNGATVATVATVAVISPQNLATDALPDPAAEARRLRVLAMLAANPLLRLAVVCDAEGDPVPVAVAIRDKGTCEVLIPAERFDPFGLLELVGRHGGTVH